MSSTNRGAERNALDLYITPDYTVNSLLSVLDLDRIRSVSFCEPCRGTGAIYNKIEAASKMHGEISEGIDYLSVPFKANVIITNPPFSLAMEFLQKSLAEAWSVFYLLRLNFLGSQKRREFWQTNRPSHVLVLSKRPSFTGHGTDSIEYAWFCWDRGNYMNLPFGVHVL